MSILSSKEQRAKSKEQRAKVGMTESDTQSYVCMEDFSGLTDGNKVDGGALPGQGLHVPVILVLHVSVMHVTYTYI